MKLAVYGNTVKTLNVTDIADMKQRGEKISCLTAYDASFSALCDAVGIDILLVGDSLGMVIQGHESTLPVSIEDMVYHTRCVSQARRRAFIIADLPFMTCPTPLIAALIHDKRDLMKRIQADPHNKALKAKMFELNRQLAEVNKSWRDEAQMQDTTKDMMMGEVKKLFRAHVGKAMRGELTRVDLNVWDRLRGKLGDQAVDGILKAIHDIEKKAVASTMQVAEAIIGPTEMFDVNTADHWIEALKSGIKAPVVSVNKSMLGGPERIGIFLMVSIDPRETWYNNILENSRYFRMSVYRDGVLKQFTKTHKIPKKFRTTRIRGLDDMIAKINRYIGEIHAPEMQTLPAPTEPSPSPFATTEDQYKSPTRKMIRKQSMFPSSFGKSRTYGGRGGMRRESFVRQLDSILEDIDGNPTR